jgi:hypothetical protein
MTGLGIFSGVINGVRDNAHRPRGLVIVALVGILAVCAVFVSAAKAEGGRTGATKAAASVSRAYMAGAPEPINLRRAKAHATRVAKKECLRMEVPDIDLRCSEAWADGCFRMVPPLRTRNRARCDGTIIMHTGAPSRKGQVYICQAVIEMVQRRGIIHHSKPIWRCAWYYQA